MDHAKISINGDDRQEGDAGSSVEKLQKELYFAHYFLFTALLKVICLYRQSNQQQNVSQDQIEQENINGLRFPELELEDEEMDNCNVQQETQDKLQHYHRRVENIQRSVLVDILLTVCVKWCPVLAVWSCSYSPNLDSGSKAISNVSRWHNCERLVYKSRAF